MYPITKEIANNEGDQIYLSASLLVRKFKDLSEDEVYMLTKRSGILQQLNHPRLAKIKEVTTDKVDYYLVEEVPTQLNLAMYLEQHKRISLGMAKWVLKDLTDALNNAHPSIIHGNLSPECIWLDIGAQHATLSTFGIFSTEVPEYLAAPELYLTNSEATIATDLYSLGAIFYLALTNQKLPNAVDVQKKEKSFMDPRSLTGLDPEWSKFIMKCLESRPSHRYESIKTVISYFNYNVKNTPQTQQRLVSPESITRGAVK